MKKIVLTPRSPTPIPVEAPVITPDQFAGKTIQEIRDLPIHYGNMETKLSEWIHAQGKPAETPEEQLIVIDGEAGYIKRIGEGMTAGRIVVQGNAGMHLGAQMQGGEITVTGDTADWTGAEMKGGLIRVLGNAGNLVGSAYRGSSEGMTGGCILVKGNIGHEAASFMRRGVLVVLGDTGEFLGAHLNGGEVVVFGKTGRRAGAQAKGNGGYIVCLGGVEELLPTYRLEAEYKPYFLRLLMRELYSKLGLEEAQKFMDTPVKRYVGDLAVGGKAEILVASKG